MLATVTSRERIPETSETWNYCSVLGLVTSTTMHEESSKTIGQELQAKNSREINLHIEEYKSWEV